MNYEQLQEEYNQIVAEKKLVEQKEKEFQAKLAVNNAFINKKGKIELNQDLYALSFGLLDYERYVGEKGALYVKTVGLAELTENQGKIFINLMNKIHELISKNEKTLSKDELTAFINEYIEPFNDGLFDEDELEILNKNFVIELQGLLNLFVSNITYDKTYADTYKLDNLFLEKPLTLKDFEENKMLNTFDFVLKSSREDQGDLMNDETYLKLIKTKQNNPKLNKVSSKESFD